MFIATLIAADRLTADDLARGRDLIARAGGEPGAAVPIDAGSAADLPFTGDVAAVRERLEAELAGVDVVVQHAAGRRKRLLVADMDSTMITIECIDELADYAGIKDEVAAVTERAMRGELDFEAALDARVTLLSGLSEDVLARCYHERVRIMPGARALVQTMRAQGGRAVLVSGGFTVFADRVAQAIGFDRAVANVLEIERGRLAGTVARPIVGAQFKRALLVSEREAAGLPAEATLAVGDGANDIPMIEAAGLGVAFRAKPKTAAAAAARIEHGDLSALLWAQGIPRAEWIG